MYGDEYQKWPFSREAFPDLVGLENLFNFLEKEHGIATHYIGTVNTPAI